MKAAALLISLTLAAGLVACKNGGGGGGKPITPVPSGPGAAATMTWSALDEYFQQLQTLSTDLHTQEAPILSTLSDSQNVEELQGALAHYPDVVDTYLEGLKKLKAPEQATQVHADAITASSDFHDALKAAITATQNVTNVDDFFGAANAVQIAVSSDSMAVACNALQQVADDNKVTVNLSCPAGATLPQ